MPGPTAWQIAFAQWRDPMNIMLTVVAAIARRHRPGGDRRSWSASWSLLNIVLGARQEMKARASVAAP